MTDCRHETWADWLNEHELPDICTHLWIVTGRGMAWSPVTTDHTKKFLIVECDNCPALGTVDDPSDTEWAMYPVLMSFKLQGSPSRVTVRELLPMEGVGGDG